MKNTKFHYKHVLISIFCLVLMTNSFAAAVSDNDGSAFISKTEFDSLKSSFQAEIDKYNNSIDSKIDAAIAAYLAVAAGSKTSKLSIECASTAEENWYICQNDPGEWVNKTPKTNITLVRVGGNYSFFQGNSLSNLSLTGTYVNLSNPGEEQNGIYATIDNEGSNKIAKLLGWYSWRPAATVLALSSGNITSNYDRLLDYLYPNSQVGTDLLNGQINFTFSFASSWTAAVESLFVCRELETKCIKKINMYNSTNNSLTIYAQVVGDRLYSVNNITTSNWTQEQYRYSGSTTGEKHGDLKSWKETYSNNYKVLNKFRNSYVSEQNKFASQGSSNLSLYDPGAGYHLISTDKKGTVSFKFQCDTSKNTNWTMEASPTKYNYSNTKTGTDVLTIENKTTKTSGTIVTVKNGDEIVLKNVEKGSIFLRIIPESNSEKYYIFYNPKDLMLEFSN